MSADARLNQEWIQGARRIEIADETRLTNPRLSLEILIQLMDELLKRLNTPE
jgi:hypothetical protein